MLTDFKKIIPADDAALITEFLRIGNSLLAGTRTERDLASFCLASQMGRR
jgi:hypothetical protein